MKNTSRLGSIRAILATIAAASCSPALLAQAAPASTINDDEPVQLSIFTVTGEKDEGYLSTQTISGSRTVEMLRDVPNSISIMNREVIEDLGVTTVDELLDFAIGGETEPSDSVVSGGSSSVFRGIVNPYNLRDGFIWYLPLDTFNIERVELLRGPNAFLYGEAAPGGSRNQLTKRARGTNSNQVRAMVGSFNLIRGELDVNRVLNDKAALRFNAVAQDAETFKNHGERSFIGYALTTRIQPFKNTVINLSYEGGDEDLVRTWLTLRNRYDTTDFNGSVANATAANSGFTYIPALGKTYEFVPGGKSGVTKISSGRSSAVTDTSIMPPEMSLTGPDMVWTHKYKAVNISIEQSIGRNLNMELSANYSNGRRRRNFPGGTKQNGLYRDVEVNLPDGTPNPNFGEYYTEYYFKQSVSNNIVKDARLAVVYDLELPFMTQRILATAQYHSDSPMRRDFGEFVDPSDPNFKGTLVNENTLAAYRTNRTVLINNRMYRRYYVKDGDGAPWTSFVPVPGVTTTWRQDVGSFGGTAGVLVEREFFSPSYGIGSSGSYWDGRIRSNIGWRHDKFHLKGSDGKGARRALYNAATDTEYTLDEDPRVFVEQDLSAWNLGGVFHVTDYLSLSYNWADSYRISQGLGSETYAPGVHQGLATGDGSEIALRWSFFDGRLISNWLRFETFMRRERGGLPTQPNDVKDELEAVFGDEFNRSGRDVQDILSAGYEFETIGNITPDWSITWNIATNEIETTNILPELRRFHALAKERGLATPLTDAFIAELVEGQPVAGYNKLRMNLITKYRFSDGPLKGAWIGGGVQYRDKTFLGNFDQDRDGSVEEIWAPGYELYSLMGGYNTKLFDRSVGFQLNVHNLFDDSVYRQRSRTNAQFDPGRTIRLSANIRF